MKKMTLMAAAAVLASTAMVGSALAQEGPVSPPFGGGGPGGGCAMMDGGYGPMGGGYGPMGGPGKDGPRGRHHHGMQGGPHGGGIHGGGMYGQISLNTPVTPARVKAVLEGQFARWGEALTVSNVTEKDKLITADVIGTDGKPVRSIAVSTETGRFFQIMTPERLQDIITGRIAMRGADWKVGNVKQDGSKITVDIVDNTGAPHHSVTFDNATGNWERNRVKR